MKIVQVYLPEDCRSGSCDCASADECRFPRCKNCDELVDSKGEWIEDNQWHKESAEPCPDCGAPI